MPTEDMEFSLGWELEACRGANHTPSGVSRGGDGSVSGEGLEYKIRTNIVKDRATSLQMLKQLATDSRILTNESCGFHVHVGLTRRTNKAAVWAGWFITLGRTVEDQAFAAVPKSRQDNRYCMRWGSTVPKESIIHKRYHSDKYSNEERYFWLNPTEMFRPRGIRTIENRLLGHTHRWAYLLAWTACTYMMADRSWKLIEDPSMLPAYAQEIRQAFKRVGEYVRERTPYSAIEAWDLAKQANLIDMSRPLEYLAVVEDRIERQIATVEVKRLFERMEVARNRFLLNRTRENAEVFNILDAEVTQAIYAPESLRVTRDEPMAYVPSRLFGSIDNVCDGCGNDECTC